MVERFTRMGSCSTALGARLQVLVGFGDWTMVPVRGLVLRAGIAAG